MDRLDQLAKIVSEANKGLATQKDVKDVIDIFAVKISNLKTEVNDKIAKNKGETDKSLQDSLTKIDNIASDLKKSLSALESNLRSELRTTTRMFEQGLDDLSTELEEKEDYDDSELKIELENIKSSIPKEVEEYDDEEILDKLKEMEDEIEELKKRPIGKGGGGTSAMAVRQAFKYIFHTESPIGDIDSVNLTYTVQNEIWAVIGFSLNGEVIAELPNYIVSGRTITFNTALPSSFSGKDFEIRYIG